MTVYVYVCACFIVCMDMCAYMCVDAHPCLHTCGGLILTSGVFLCLSPLHSLRQGLSPAGVRACQCWLSSLLRGPSLWLPGVVVRGSCTAPSFDKGQSCLHGKCFILSYNPTPFLVAKIQRYDVTTQTTKSCMTRHDPSTQEAEAGRS